MEFYYHGSEGDILILSADGGLNSDNARKFVERLKVLVRGGVTKIVVDCTRLKHISSYGVGVLVRLHKRLAEEGGEVKLANLEHRVFKVLRVVGLDGVFAIYANVDEACSSFSSSSGT